MLLPMLLLMLMMRVAVRRRVRPGFRPVAARAVRGIRPPVVVVGPRAALAGRGPVPGPAGGADGVGTRVSNGTAVVRGPAAMNALRRAFVRVVADGADEIVVRGELKATAVDRGPRVGGSPTLVAMMLLLMLLLMLLPGVRVAGVVGVAAVVRLPLLLPAVSA